MSIDLGDILWILFWLFVLFWIFSPFLQRRSVEALRQSRLVEFQRKRGSRVKKSSRSRAKRPRTSVAAK